MLKSILHHLRTTGERFAAWADLNDLSPAKPLDATYRVYTKEFDIVIDGAKLAGSDKPKTPEYVTNPYAKIDLVAFERMVEALRANCGALSARLQQTLTPKQRDDTVITLLFDHSGSLRAGACYLTIAEVAEALADALTSAGIATEILGFTTRRWEGGQSCEKWLKDGRPPLPGRLNDLLHIVHLDASGGPRSGPHRFQSMRDERRYKENIDGEALEWAYARLLENTRRRRVLIIVSDGAPVDDSTLTHNWSSILHDHVKEVSHRIASSTNIVLGGIGIEHSVQNYYSNEAVAKPIAQLAHVAPDFIEKMIAVAHRSPTSAEDVSTANGRA
jgi:cobaltochelatase CobT